MQFNKNIIIDKKIQLWEKYIFNESQNKFLEKLLYVRKYLLKFNKNWQIKPWYKIFAYSKTVTHSTMKPSNTLHTTE